MVKINKMNKISLFLIILDKLPILPTLTTLQKWVTAIKTKNLITKYITNYFRLCNWYYQLK